MLILGILGLCFLGLIFNTPVFSAYQPKDLAREYGVLANSLIHLLPSSTFLAGGGMDEISQVVLSKFFKDILASFYNNPQTQGSERIYGIEEVRGEIPSPLTSQEDKSLQTKPPSLSNVNAKEEKKEGGQYNLTPEPLFTPEEGAKPETIRVAIIANDEKEFSAVNAAVETAIRAAQPLADILITSVILPKNVYPAGPKLVAESSLLSQLSLLPLGISGISLNDIFNNREILAPASVQTNFPLLFQFSRLTQPQINIPPLSTSANNFSSPGSSIPPLSSSLGLVKEPNNAGSLAVPSGEILPPSEEEKKNESEGPSSGQVPGLSQRRVADSEEEFGGPGLIQKSSSLINPGGSGETIKVGILDIDPEHAAQVKAVLEKTILEANPDAKVEIITYILPGKWQADGSKEVRSDAILAALAQAQAEGVQVLNMSIGPAPDPKDPRKPRLDPGLVNELQGLKEKGMIIITASGNEGGLDAWREAGAVVISVGACGTSYSNTADICRNPVPGKPGTSFTAPQVAGEAAALLTRGVSGTVLTNLLLGQSVGLSAQTIPSNPGIQFPETVLIPSFFSPSSFGESSFAGFGLVSPGLPPNSSPSLIIW